MNFAESTDHPDVYDRHIIDPFHHAGPPDFAQPIFHYDDIRFGCKYYSMPTVSNTQNTSTDNSFDIIHINVRSIFSNEKFEQLQLFLHRSGHKWHIICLSETWLSQDLENMRNIEGYTGFF